MNTPTTIVWVYGGSAAGKETFIHTAVDKRSADLLKQLGWENRELIACSKSLDLIAQYTNDPVGEQREEILEQVSELAVAHPGSIILVKGQDLDLQNNRQRRLKLRLPDMLHRIIFLGGDSKEHFARWQDKSWYKLAGGYSEDTVHKWLMRQLKMLMPLKDEFGIIALDSGAGKNYTAAHFPPFEP